MHKIRNNLPLLLDATLVERYDAGQGPVLPSKSSVLRWAILLAGITISVRTPSWVRSVNTRLGVISAALWIGFGAVVFGVGGDDPSRISLARERHGGRAAPGSAGPSP